MRKRCSLCGEILVNDGVRRFCHLRDDPISVEHEICQDCQEVLGHIYQHGAKEKDKIMMKPTEDKELKEVITKLVPPPFAASIADDILWVVKEAGYTRDVGDEAKA